ncbi:MAG: hypothetical protein Q9195_007965 [Heterodermia aff. obscurata]
MAKPVGRPPAAASPKYSTLELAKHDATTAAPERDHAIVAPENDRQLDAPQVDPVSGSEVFYSDTPPEALDIVKNRRPTKRNGSIDTTSRPFTPCFIIIVTAIIATVLVGATVGVGVGVGLKKQISGSDSTTVVANTITRTASLRQEQILTVFYILANSSLTSTIFLGGEWMGGRLGNLSNYTAAADSRHFSGNTTLLFYESPKGGVGCLNSSFEYDNDPALSSSSMIHPWYDVSKELQDANQWTGLQFGAPFTTTPCANGIDATFAGKYTNGSYSEDLLGFEAEYGFDTGEQHSPVIPHTLTQIDIWQGNILDSIQYSNNLVLGSDYRYGFWVNGTTLVQLGDRGNSNFFTVPSLPRSPFPFARMAGLSDTNSSSMFIYHQLNASAFVEELWDGSEGVWTSNTITISMV